MSEGLDRALSMLYRQLAEVVASRPFGDEEQSAVFAIAYTSAIPQIVEQLDLARVERDLCG